MTNLSTKELVGVLEFNTKLIADLANLSKQDALKVAMVLSPEVGDAFVCWWQNGQKEKETHFFTIYWRDGRRQIITSSTIMDAFIEAGYGNDAFGEVDWYDNGITETHYYDVVQKSWVRYEDIKIHILDFNYSSIEILKIFHTHTAITVQLENKDELIIKKEWGHYSFGWINTITITYGSYQKGSYDGSDPDDHHYIASGTEYFPISQISTAVEAFVSRVKGKPSEPSDLFSLNLQEIAELQPITTGYVV